MKLKRATLIVASAITLIIGIYCFAIHCSHSPIKEWKTERETLTEELRETLADNGLDERAQSAFLSRLNRELANGGKLSAEMQKRIEEFNSGDLKMRKQDGYFGKMQYKLSYENDVRDRISQIQHTDKKTSK